MNERILELEKRSAYQEQLLDDLNEVVVKQQQQIDRLEKDVCQMKQQMARKVSEVEDPHDEKPPHY